MRYLSVCSGIEAATVAWHPLGWEPVAFSEIEKFPSQVLAHHYPAVPNLGDMTKFEEWPDADVDVLVGGTPCQSFSVAGLRKGLADPRGNLMLTYLAIAAKYRPQWLVWENVPGVLSSHGGRDFASLLQGLAELGYGFAYRILDAIHFGCAVPRPRVFVVGNSRAGWRASAAVLFEQSAFDNCPKRTTQRPRLHTLSTKNAGSKNGRGNIIAEIDGWRGMTPKETERALGFTDDYTKITKADRRERPGNETRMEHENALRADPEAVCGHAEFAEHAMRVVRGRNGSSSSGSLPPDGTGSRDFMPPVQHQAAGSRGHGMGDAGVGVPGRDMTPDGPRYKALGNSMAVPVMRWIGERIALLESIDG